MQMLSHPLWPGSRLAVVLLAMTLAFVGLTAPAPAFAEHSAGATYRGALPVGADVAPTGVALQLTVSADGSSVSNVTFVVGGFQAVSLGAPVGSWGAPIVNHAFAIPWIPRNGLLAVDAATNTKLAQYFGQMSLHAAFIPPGIIRGTINNLLQWTAARVG
jgi:hypothetical protein